MSRTLNLTCRQCRQTLWVGQHSLSRDEWYIYGPEPERAQLARFVNEHMRHDVRFEDSELVPDDFTHMDEEWEMGGGSIHIQDDHPN